MLREPLLAPAGKQPPALLCHFGLALTQLLSSCGLVYIRIVIGQAQDAYDSVAFIFWRFAGATPLLLIAAAAAGGVPHRPSWAEAQHFLALGAFLVCNQLFANLGVALAGALIATCMQPLSPVLGAVLAMLTGQERLAWRNIVGLVTAVSGALVVAAGRAEGGAAAGGGGGGAVLAGVLCLALHSGGWAAYCVGVKGMAGGRLGSLGVTGAAQTAGLLLMAAIVALRQAVAPSAPGLRLPAAAYAPLAYWIIVVSGACYWVVAWASRRLPASTVTLYAALQPAVGAALSVAVLGEQLRWTDLGALGIITGLVVVVVGKREVSC